MKEQAPNDGEQWLTFDNKPMARTTIMTGLVGLTPYRLHHSTHRIDTTTTIADDGSDLTDDALAQTDTPADESDPASDPMDEKPVPTADVLTISADVLITISSSELFVDNKFELRSEEPDKSLTSCWLGFFNE